MCMGYAKDIKAWVCPQETSRREHALGLWGELMRQGTLPSAGPEPVRARAECPPTANARQLDPSA